MTAMTASDVRDLVDAWCCAIRLLPSDPGALAALLKSDTPMPNGVRYLIGEIFYHGNPPLIDVTVVPKRGKALTKAIDKLNVEVEYRNRLANHQPSQEAAADVADRRGISDRQVYRYVAEGPVQQFRDRVNEFADKINSGNVSDRREQIAHDDGESANHIVLGTMSMAG